MGQTIIIGVKGLLMFVCMFIYIYLYSIRFDETKGSQLFCLNLAIQRQPTQRVQLWSWYIDSECHDMVAPSRSMPVPY